MIWMTAIQLVYWPIERGKRISVLYHKLIGDNLLDRICDWAHTWAKPRSRSLSKHKQWALRHLRTQYWNCHCCCCVFCLFAVWICHRRNGSNRLLDANRSTGFRMIISSRFVYQSYIGASDNCWAISHFSQNMLVLNCCLHLINSLPFLCILYWCCFCFLLEQRLAIYCCSSIRALLLLSQAN